MDVEFDPAKDIINQAKHGMSLSLAGESGFFDAVVKADDRNDYGETRHVALGWIGDRLHVLCFTATATGLRAISLRKANQREVKRYEKATD